MQLFTENSKLLTNCTNLFGSLKDDVRQRLLAVLNDPCQETWEDAYSIIVAGPKMTTLWQAVIAVDQTFPRSKPAKKPWPRIPDQFALCRAIKAATTMARLAEEREAHDKAGR